MEEKIVLWIRENTGWVMLTPLILIVAQASWVLGVLPAYDWFKKEWGRNG